MLNGTLTINHKNINSLNDQFIDTLTNSLENTLPIITDDEFDSTEYLNYVINKEKSTKDKIVYDVSKSYEVESDYKEDEQLIDYINHLFQEILENTMRKSDMPTYNQALNLIEYLAINQIWLNYKMILFDGLESTGYEQDYYEKINISVTPKISNNNKVEIITEVEAFTHQVYKVSAKLLLDHHFIEDSEIFEIDDILNNKEYQDFIVAESIFDTFEEFKKFYHEYLYNSVETYVFLYNYMKFIIKE